LLSQFAGRRQHQAADGVAADLAFFFAQALQYRQRKAGGLASAGLGSGQRGRRGWLALELASGFYSRVFRGPAGAGRQGRGKRRS
jgi:hypothetical protein